MLKTLIFCVPTQQSYARSWVKEHLFTKDLAFYFYVTLLKTVDVVITSIFVFILVSYSCYHLFDVVDLVIR